MLSETLERPARAAPPSSLTRIADLAPTLKEAELRVLVHLTVLAEADAQKSCRISARELAAATKRQGTATRPAAYLLNFLNTAKIGGPPKGPPQPVLQEDLDLQEDHQMVSLEDHSGPGKGPPPTDSKAEKDGPSRASIESRFDYEVIDRLLKADPGKSDP